MLMNDILIRQINSSPEPLRSYIHILSIGVDADILLQNEQLRQENEEMKFVLSQQPHKEAKR